MKLSTTQIDQIRSQIGANPVPESDPVQQRLEEYFGEHTFFVDMAGLYVWETVEEPETPQAQAVAIKIASWANEERTLLEGHEPQPIGTTVVLETAQ